MKEQNKTNKEVPEIEIKNEKETQLTAPDAASDEDIQFIGNAGIVILAPYLPRLFSLLELTEGNRFKTEEAQIRGMFVIQYLVYETTGFPEHEMTLNRILTHFPAEKPIPKEIELTSEEKETCESLLKGALQNWPKLRNTSVSGLREYFLQRGGKLEEKEDIYRLTVEEKAYDILLDCIPWSFRLIRCPWMPKAVEVKWR